jgi:voltage-gated sodium channel
VACWPRPLRFFADGWNVFDFVVVAASLLPQSGTFAMVARLARLLRVTRLVAVFPELRLIVSTMLRSIPSMGHVIMMLGLLLYVYAVLGVAMFREEDPEHWSSLGVALLTLLQAAHQRMSLSVETIRQIAQGSHLRLPLNCVPWSAP